MAQTKSAVRPLQKYRRFRLLTRVTQTHGQTTFWRSENISESGMFIRAAPSLAVGTQAEVGFFLPDVPEEIVCTIEVVWTNDVHAPDYRPQVSYGMGVRFVRLRPEHQRQIAAYVAAGLELHVAPLPLARGAK